MNGHFSALVALLRLVFSHPVTGGFGEDAGGGGLAELGPSVRLFAIFEVFGFGGGAVYDGHVVRGQEGFLLLLRQRKVGGRRLLRSAVVALLRRGGTGLRLARFGFVAPGVHSVGELIVSQRVAGRLAAWRDGASLQSDSFRFQHLKRKELQ